ncbi:MAG: response regulator transcription factor [Anaerolineae bacterium]|nr:response regulator transcription factor [Anaerolineae bacterium]
MKGSRVLLVDDHPLFRDGIASLLTAWDMTVVGQASDGEEAIEKAGELQPDLILMDIHMSGMNGLEATRQIKARWPDIQIVILTVSEEDEFLFEAIKSGAQGYLLKNLDTEKFGELLAGLEMGEAALPRRLASRILREFARQTQPPNEQKEEVDALTTREIEVLQLLGEGGSNRDIASSLSVSENTIKYHVRNILSKLHLRSRSQVAAYIAHKKTNPKTAD